MPADAQVAWCAARQHGVVARGQLVAAGITRSGIERRVAAGWLHRLHRGVFAVGHPGLSRRGRWMAAVLAGGTAGVLSHRSAGALWGMCIDASGPEITVPGRKRHAQADVTVHSGAIRPGDVVLLDGIRVTKVARTLLDLAEVLTVEQLVRAVDQATAARHLHPDLMSSMIRQTRGRRGLKPLKQALLITRPQDVLTRSQLERRALRLITNVRLPAPEANVRLHRYEVDLLWRAHRVVVELDGREWHDTPAAFERDRRRDADLMAHGWRVLRFTWRQVVNDPVWVAARLSAVLARGGEPSSAAA